MMRSLSLDMNFLILITTTILHVLALRDVKVKIPPAVKRGERAILKCSYDMEGDSLYSVKWYKGRREFYRYTPRENPPMKTFPTAGIKVERHMSNESQLSLGPVIPTTSGKYSCEVSADAPSFHTLISSGELEIVEVPIQKPIIIGIRLRYRIGEILRGNCTSGNSKPAANLTWTINSNEANPFFVRTYKSVHDSHSDLETSVSQIQFVIGSQYFFRGKLKIRCTAHIYDIYSQSAERNIEEERPKILTESNSNSVNLVQNYPYDQFSLEDEDIIDKKDTYMTHVQGEMSSLNSGTKSFLPSSSSFRTILFCILQFLHTTFFSSSTCPLQDIQRLHRIHTHILNKS